MTPSHEELRLPRLPEKRTGTVHPASTPTRPARLPDWVGAAPGQADVSSALPGAPAPPPEDTPESAPSPATPPAIAEPEAVSEAVSEATAAPDDTVPAPQGDEHEAKQTVQPTAAESRRLDALAAEIHGIGQRLEAFREGAERRAAACFGAAAESCLPTMAQAGFAQEVAHACLAIAREGRAETLVLSLAPSELHAVAAALEARNPEIGFQLVADRTLDAGRARISWPQGGANMVADRVAAAALHLMSQRLGKQAPAKGHAEHGAKAPGHVHQQGERP
ncbi:MAG: hypothetical protein AAFU72_05110 [Pseudomonadota bacterium]